MTRPEKRTDRPRVLWVDVDGTLLVWPYHAEFAASYGETTLDDRDERPNLKLVEAVKSFMDANPNWGLVVWSGGGKDYAARWARKCLGEDYPSSEHYWRWEAGAKDNLLPMPYDVVIDDMPDEMRFKNAKIQRGAGIKELERIDEGCLLLFLPEEFRAIYEEGQEDAGD